MPRGCTFLVVAFSLSLAACQPPPPAPTPTAAADPATAPAPTVTPLPTPSGGDAGWPTGVGEGEFVPRGAAPFGGRLLARQGLVCQGRDLSVWYRAPDRTAATLGNRECSFILAVEGACADGRSLTEATQAIGDLLVASFQR